MTNERNPRIHSFLPHTLRVFLPVLFFLVGLVGSAQNFGGVRLSIEDFEYDSVQVSVGDTIRLGSGSDVNGFFSFVDGFTKAGRGSRPFRPNDEYSNSIMVVTHFVTYGLDPVPICRSATYENRSYAFYFKLANLEDAILNEELVLASK
ncbi:MAG: hypothetical protein AAGA85_22970 [Bacteroidota bacterium]